jgi:hypothetical protein
MSQAEEGPTLAIGFDVAEQPDHGRAAVGGKDRVGVRMLVDKAGEILWVNLPAMTNCRALVERCDRLSVLRQTIIKDLRSVRATMRGRRAATASLMLPTTPNSTGWRRPRWVGSMSI